MVTVKMGEGFAPYAPYSAVVEVIRRYRERGLPDPVTLQALEMVGVSPSMTGIVVKALVFLRLIDEGGNKTEAFERLRKANSEESKQVLAEIVRAAYVDVFTVVDPAQDSKVSVDDAFRRYEPATQRSKMVRLFLGLCQEAGIVDKKPRKTPSSQVPRIKKPKDKELPPELPVSPPASPAEERRETSDRIDAAPSQRLLAAIFQQLPPSGKWTAEKRNRWLAAMTSAVDLIIETEGGISGRGQPSSQETSPSTGS